MATRFEKLDGQLDRLGKLFSRKKRAADSHDSAGARNKPATPIPFLTGLDATSQTFPEPSFIRPTSSRMVAREEVLWTSHSSRRARSLPESPRTPRLTAPASRTDAENGCPAIPARYSSLRSTIARRSSSLYPPSSTDDPSSELRKFSFSTASRGSEGGSSPRRRSRPSSKPLIRSPSASVSPKARDRKRYLASTQDKVPRPHDDQTRVCKQSNRQCKTPGLAPLQLDSHCLAPASGAYLAPPLSPRPVPLAKPSRDEHHGKASHRPRSLSISGSNIKHIGEALRKATSLSNLLTAKDPDSDPTLKEPSVKDFLALSDDDIADGHAASRTQPPASNPPTFALPPNPSPASTPLRTKPAPTKPAYPLLTLSPPLASRPAAEAAIEAARIATKYQFDLVYVVNMWPKHMSRPGGFCGTPAAMSPARTPTPSPPESPVSHTSGYDSGFESRTPAPRDNSRSGAATGRLMAAYGLPSIMYPFRISAPVHQKVLRTQGWLEYRNDSGAQDEFARGYSCSFYTGYSPARGREPDRTATTTTDGKPKDKPANRGLVFAAFRVPREDGTPVCSSPEELEALHKDAEGLVDMLIDHVRAPITPSRRCAAGPKGRMTMKTGAPLVAI